jgi:hypothetical protein
VNNGRQLLCVLHKERKREWVGKGGASSDQKGWRTRVGEGLQVSSRECRVAFAHQTREAFTQVILEFYDARTVNTGLKRESG